MKIAGKDFKDYWKFIKIPTLVLVAWAVLGLIVSIISYSLYKTIFSPYAGWILTLAAFGFIGWTAVKDNKLDVKIAAWAGAVSGAIVGFAGAIISILMFTFVPALMQEAVNQATQRGADAATVQSFMKIGVYIGIVTGPLISGVIAGIIAAVAAFIAKKIK